MNTYRYALGIVLLLLLLPSTLLAQEKSEKNEKNLTEPEELYEQLKELKKPAEKKLAQRWYNLVKRRSWTDQSGKHKTFAKYLDHDPDFQWVKLLVLTRKGDTRTEKEVTVPLAKLDKKGKSVVNRIAFAREKIEELLSDTSTEGGPNARRAEQGYAREGGYGSYQGGEAAAMAIPAPTNENEKESEKDALSQEEPDQPYGYPPSATEPDARQLPEPGREAQEFMAKPGQIPAPMQTLTTLSSSQVDPNQPDLPDQSPWRTSYQAFSEQLSASRGEREGWVLDWGGLDALAARYEAFRAPSRVARGELSQEQVQPLFLKAAMAARELGEVVWEATLKSPIVGPSQAIWFELPPLPEPFGIVFLCEQKNAGDFGRFQAGEKVQFIGRFDGFIDEHLLLIRLRFPDQPLEDLTDEPQITMPTGSYSSQESDQAVYPPVRETDEK